MTDRVEITQQEAEELFDRFGEVALCHRRGEVFTTNDGLIYDIAPLPQFCSASRFGTARTR